ncbi:MAG: hypothetical protein HYX27_17600 [Acidobacteria bacterium]|nr:hypothetical protein [Acidobacteriota bacterium]
MPALRPAHILAAVFALSFAFISWLCGNRLILINDEGIFLSHAARIAEGEVLYKDLFGITGPGSYWLLALVFKIAGVSLAAAHVILALEISALTTAVYFVTRELADAASAGIAAFVFLALNSADPSMMTNNHRWDADTYAILGIVSIWRGRPLLGGFLLALAVWTTPILALAAIAAVGASLLIQQSPWRVIAGGAIGAAAGIIALLLTHSLGAFIENLLWAKSNYSEANRMGYGAVIGGYPALFEGATGIGDYAVRALIVVGLTLPVWLPPLCGLLVLRNRDRNLLYFCVCGLSMIAGVSPRFDVGHLVFAVPLFYPVAASFLQRARWAVLPVGAIAGVFLFSAVLNRANTELIDTPVGRVRTDHGSAELVQWLTTNIQPGERMFVYPYPPVAYFLTRGQNISRFSVLQPGLFTLDDEKLATDEMRRRPPSKVLYMDVAPEEFLRIWPATDPSRLQLRHIHSFVTANYQDTAQFRNLHIYTPTVRASNVPQ